MLSVTQILRRNRAWLLTILLLGVATSAPAAGPQVRVRHICEHEVVISWQTDQPGPSIVEYGVGKSPPKRLEHNAHKTAHAVTLDGLEPGQRYQFKIKTRGPNNSEQTVGQYGFDSACDLRRVDAAAAPSPFPADRSTSLCAAAARQIVAASGVDRGYCLVLGCGDGRLALELARLTNLQIIGVEEDAERADAARRALDAAGIYGIRAVVHHARLDRLPYCGRTANLVVSQQTILSGRLPPSVAEVCRVLRPYGGVAWFGQTAEGGKHGGKLTRAALEDWIRQSPLSGWEIQQDAGLSAVLRRGRLPRSGEWTHLYADAGNSACSDDPLRGPLQLQWFGRPGPRQAVDRHNRNMAPLVKGGRLLVVGNDRVKAVDAYNGTPLWDLTIPNSRRTTMTRDCGQAALTDDLLYIAVEDTCRAIDVCTGRRVDTFEVPQLDAARRRHWGYLAWAGDRLFGSAGKPEAPFSALSSNSWTPGYADNRPMVTSEWLFCLERHSGRKLWVYGKPGGSVFINPAIALGDGRVYFIESRSPAALANPSGRVPLSVALAKGTTRLVALDAQTGRLCWQHPVDLSVLRHCAYLSHARGTLLITGSDNQNNHPRYHLLAFDAEGGRPKWSGQYVRADKKANGTHGEQDQHPAIVGEVVYSRPVAFDLETGRRRPFNLDRAGHGCGTLSASASYLFGRGGNPQMYPLSGGGRSSTAVTAVTRPGCWINIIPAGGLLLIPEGSSGCSCPYSLQTSVVLTPTLNQGDPQ